MFAVDSVRPFFDEEEKGKLSKARTAASRIGLIAGGASRYIRKQATQENTNHWKGEAAKWEQRAKDAEAKLDAIEAAKPARFYSQF